MQAELIHIRRGKDKKEFVTERRPGQNFVRCCDSVIAPRGLDSNDSPLSWPSSLPHHESQGLLCLVR